MSEHMDKDREKRRQLERRRQREKKRRRDKMLKIGLFLIIAVVVGFWSFGMMKSFMMSSGEEPVLTGETVTVTIPEGASTSSIAEILKEN